MGFTSSPMLWCFHTASRCGTIIRVAYALYGLYTTVKFPQYPIIIITLHMHYLLTTNPMMVQLYTLPCCAANRWLMHLVDNTLFKQLIFSYSHSVSLAQQVKGPILKCLHMGWCWVMSTPCRIGYLCWQYCRVNINLNASDATNQLDTDVIEYLISSHIQPLLAHCMDEQSNNFGFCSHVFECFAFIYLGWIRPYTWKVCVICYHSYLVPSALIIPKQIMSEAQVWFLTYWHFSYHVKKLTHYIANNMMKLFVNEQHPGEIVNILTGVHATLYITAILPSCKRHRRVICQNV